MYFLGIDGGGTRTRALLSDASGRIVGQGLSGATNPRTIAHTEVEANLLDAIKQASEGIARHEICAAHLGLAGASDASTQERVLAIARESLEGARAQITVGHDLETALEGGFAGAPGMVLLAGTGSASYGRNEAGEISQCGGWGDLVDDAGSGSWLGLRALQACVRQADGRQPESALIGTVMTFLAIDSMTQFKSRLHDQGLTRTERAQLAPIVIDLAASNDPAAALILSEALEELCRLAKCTRQALKLVEAPVLQCGGLTRHNYFQNNLKTRLHKHGFEVVETRPRMPAVAGAVLLALKSAKIRANGDIISRLAET